jgi:hypothetical protein
MRNPVQYTELRFHRPLRVTTLRCSETGDADFPTIVCGTAIGPDGIYRFRAAGDIIGCMHEIDHGDFTVGIEVAPSTTLRAAVLAAIRAPG